jgi:hypothetical protein
MADIARIKSNIGKMIAQNAPEADIDEYVASEGLTPEALRNGGTQPSMAADVAKSAGVGLGKGIIGLGGMIGDLSDLGAKGLETATNFVSDKLGVERYQRPEAPSALNNIPTSASLTKNVESVTGKFYEPKTTAGKYAETVGEFLPAAAAGPGRMGTKLLSGVTGGLGSEAAGQFTEGTAAEPYARVAGALAGGMAPMAAGRAVTPLPASARHQRLVDILQNEGVTSLTAGQRTGNNALKYAESILGDGPGAGQGASRIQQEGQEQFTRAAMRRAGQGLDDATPETLLANNQRLGNEFQTLAGRNTMAPDNQFINDVTAAVRQYRNVPDSQQARMIQGYIDDIVPYINAGGMPGAEYQAMRSRMSRQANNNRQSDPDLAEALRGFRNALDNAMGRSISPADREAWQAARREYGAQKTIEKTASRAGEATAEGQLVPSNLRNTVSAENRGAYARGEGQFSELARAGEGVMKPLPNSGTAQRNLLTDIAKMLVTAPAGRALTSAPVQGYLGNQAIAETLRNLPPARQAALIALLGESGRARLEGPR